MDFLGEFGVGPCIADLENAPQHQKRKTATQPVIFLNVLIGRECRSMEAGPLPKHQIPRRPTCARTAQVTQGL